MCVRACACACVRACACVCMQIFWQEPIPVRIEDGYYDDEATTSGGGWSDTSW